MAGAIDLSFLHKIAFCEINRTGYYQSVTKSAAPRRFTEWCDAQILLTMMPAFLFVILCIATFCARERGRDERRQASQG
jgi:hypothetical protein